MEVGRWGLGRTKLGSGKAVFLGVEDGLALAMALFAYGKKKKQLGMGEMHDIGICFTCMELFRMNPVQQFRTN